MILKGAGSAIMNYSAFRRIGFSLINYRLVLSNQGLGKLMMSSAPAKFAGGARYASQDPFIHSFIDCPIQLISTPNAFKSTFFLRRT